MALYAKTTLISLLELTNGIPFDIQGITMQRKIFLKNCMRLASNISQKKLSKKFPFNDILFIINPILILFKFFQ